MKKILFLLVLTLACSSYQPTISEESIKAWIETLPRKVPFPAPYGSYWKEDKTSMQLVQSTRMDSVMASWIGKHYSVSVTVLGTYSNKVDDMEGNLFLIWNYDALPQNRPRRVVKIDKNGFIISAEWFPY